MAKILSPEKVKERYELLKSERGNWETHWQDIADYILPRKNDFTVKQTPGVKRNFQVFDNTGMQSCELLAGALHGMLTNPSSLWFELTTGDKLLDQNDAVRRWLQDTTLRIHHRLNQTNFQTEVHELYLDLCGFGTAPMLILEDDETDIRFQATYLREVFIEENEKGLVDEVYRTYCWSAKQIIAFFGEKNVPEEVLECWKLGKSEKFDIVHAVYDRNAISGDQEYKIELPIVSQYVMVKGLKQLKVGGFSENPWVVPRWSKAAGETYGRSPGMTALPEVKTINKMTETMIRGAQKTIDPPLQAPDDGFVLNIRTAPGSINYYRSGSNNKDRIEPIYNDARIDFGFQITDSHRTRIREAFYVDQLQLQQGPQMTATEVMQRTEEKMRLLGPMLGRMQAEFLKPMIDRIFAIMFRKKRFLQPPRELSGRNIDVQYSSFIAKMQRETEANNIQKAMAAITPFASFAPQILDNLDPDEAFRGLARIYSFPQDMLRDQDDVEEMRAQRAQQQEAMAKAQAEAQQAEIIGKAGPAAAQLQMAETQAAEAEA